MPRVKTKTSICGRYKAKTETIYSEAIIVDTETGVTYEKEPIEKSGSFYAKPYMTMGYSCLAEIDGEIIDNHFTLRFADCKEGVEIIPFKGNTVINEYEAIFRN